MTYTVTVDKSFQLAEALLCKDDFLTIQEAQAAYTRAIGLALISIIRAAEESS